MKLNLKKINYHKWIPSRFSSFQAKLLIAFLVATLLPLTLVALVSYHVSYNLARDRIINSALMSDEQLIFQLNSCVFVLFRTNPAMFSNMLIVLHLTAMNFPGIFRLLLLIPQFPVTF